MMKMRLVPCVNLELGEVTASFKKALSSLQTAFDIRSSWIKTSEDI